MEFFFFFLLELSGHCCCVIIYLISCGEKYYKSDRSMFFIANDCQPVQCCGIFVRVLRKDTETRIKLKGRRVNRSARVQKGVFLMVEFSFFFALVASPSFEPLFTIGSQFTQREHTHIHTYYFVLPFFQKSRLVTAAHFSYLG